MTPRFPFRVGALLGVLALAACQTPQPLPRDPGPAAGGVPERVVVPEIDPEIFANVPSQDEDEVVRVALLLPFEHGSENIEIVANSMLKAAQMVAFESRNESYLLIPKDTMGTPEGALAAAEDAIREGAEIILGPLFSESVGAIAPLTRAADVPVIAFSSDMSVAGDGVYLLSFPPEDEVARVTSYAVSKGYARFGMMAPYTELGDRVARAFSTEVYELGGEMVHEERYERAADAMAQPARRLARFAARTFVPQYVTPRVTAQQQDAYAQGIGDDPYAGPGADPYDAETEAMTPVASSGEGFQAVLLPESGRLLRALAPWLPTYDVDIREVKLLGLSSWNNPLLQREPALQGGWFAAPDPALAAGFKERYRKAYGENPPPLASLAYDAALLTARLSELPERVRFSGETIANPNGYLGADGLFRLRSDGTVERGLAIMEIQPSGITVIDPAPRSFAEDTGF